MAYGVKILADSVTRSGHRITTMEVTFQRFILAEFNTHRMFSRNSASSRAIPSDVLLKKVQEDPACPVFWGKYQKGMSASVELTGAALVDAKARWLEARDNAVASARHLKNIGGENEGLHKQLTNRLLEPWMWQTVICTATEWSNFYALRISKFAQPEIKVIAEMMKEAQDASTPVLLNTGEWHLPLVDEVDRIEDLVRKDPDFLVKVSTARCARVSYLTHDAKRDWDDEVAMHDWLTGNGHLSPCEHQATPMDAFLQSGGSGNFQGWVQYRKTLKNEQDFSQWDSE